MSGLLLVFTTVLLAELGDKTQIATLVFAARNDHAALGVFLAAAGALILATGLAVLVGLLATRYLDALPLKLISGLVFIALGAWSVLEHFQGA